MLAVKLYGIAEIANALEVDRHLVAQWYRRSSRNLSGGMDLPKPNAVLSMSPVWTGQTLNSWLRVMKRKLKEA